MSVAEVVFVGTQGPPGPAGATGPAGPQGPGATWTEGEFSTVIEFAERLKMEDHIITGPTTFTAGEDPQLFTETYVKVQANGTNVPTFAGMTEWGGSLGWDNTAGMINNIFFFWDGSTYYYSITQDLGATPVPVAPGIPVLSVGTIASDSVGLTWTLPSGGTPDDYIVEYREPAGAWGVFADGTSTTRSATVTGLTPETAYEFRVSATNSVGTSDPSNVIEATTIEEVTEAFIQFEQRTGMTESGDGTVGWSYTGQTYSEWQDYAQDSQGLAGDAFVKFQPRTRNMFGFHASATPANFGTSHYAPYIEAGGNLMVVRMADNATTCNVVPGLNLTTDGITHIRVSKQGAVLSTHISDDNEATWTLVDQYTDPAGTRTLYPWIGSGQAGIVGPILSGAL